MGELKGILGSGNDKTTGLLIIPTLRELPYNESTFAATGLFPHDSSRLQAISHRTFHENGDETVNIAHHF